MKQTSWWEKTLSFILIPALLFCFPLGAYCQSQESKKAILAAGTSVNLQIAQEYDMEKIKDNVPLKAIVLSDVMSADGSDILIKEGSQALVYYTVSGNGNWGKSGKICLSHAFIKAVDGQTIPLHPSTCKSGQSYTGFVIGASILFFPIGLLTGLIKGDMPTIKDGTMFNTYAMQDTYINVTPAE